MVTIDEDTFVGACLKSLQQKAFYSTYWKTFAVRPADTDARKEECFRLRYDVFCKENDYLERKLYANKLEKDVFDDTAVHHVLIHNATDRVVGTVRTLLPNPAALTTSFEMQDLCDHPLLHIEERAKNMCEISRLCMVADFRKRPHDGNLLPAYYEQEWEEDGSSRRRILFRRLIPYAPLGLLKAAFETALQNGIVNGMMLLETKQSETMKRLGFEYRVLGPRIVSLGMLQPLIFNIKGVLDNMADLNPECWDIISDKGALARVANQLYQNDWQDSVFDEACRDMILRKLL